MNPLIKKTLAIGLCASICLCGGGMSRIRPQSEATAAVRSTQSAGEDEVLYVLTDADGTVQKILTGTESQSAAAEQDLPIDLSVSCTLDGKAIAMQDLRGQSGHVVIRFEYENNRTETVHIGDKTETLHVPLAALTGMMLDDGVFQNVTVSGGRLVDDGDRIFVIGVAFPGLQEDLALDRDTLDIPDRLELDADVTDFEFGMTVTLVTGEPFAALDDTALSSAEDASASLSALTDAMGQLLDGSSALHEGLDTLLEKCDALADGVSALADGASSLQSGANELKAGANELKTGASELDSGLSTLSSNSATLNSGAATVFNSLLSTANDQLAAAGLSVSTLTMANYASVLGALIDSLDETAVYDQAYAQVSAAVEAQRSTIEEAVTAAVRESVSAQVRSSVEDSVKGEVTAAVRTEVTAQVLASQGISQEEYEAADEQTKAMIDAAIEEQMASDAVQSQISTSVATQMQSDAIQAVLTQNTDEQMQSDAVQATIAQNVEAQIQQAIADGMASDSVQSQLAAASEGARSVIALKTSLDSYNAFYLGLLTYTAGVDSAASGAGELVSGAGALSAGAGSLASGAGELRSGVTTLQESMPALTEGVTELRDGAEALSDGLNELNEQFMEQCLSLFDDNASDRIDRLSAILDLARHNETGSTKYIYRTDEILTD